MKLPLYTSVDEIDKVVDVLYSRIKEIPVLEAQKINKSLFSTNNVQTFSFIGLISVNDSGIKLTELGRKYNSGDTVECLEILKGLIKKINIYDTTLEYYHHNQKLNPTKTDTGSYWHENFTEKISDLSEEELTSAVVFFYRLCEKAGLGKYINAGRGRETHINFDNVQLAEYVTTKVKISKPITEGGKITESVSNSLDVNSEKSMVTDHINELSPSSLRALGKLEIGLSWKELDSDGAKKLIIEKLDDLQQENIVLKAKVEKIASIDKTNAVLLERNKNLEKMNLIRTSVNSIGGVVLGASFSISDLIPKIAGVILGAILIVLSIFLRDKNENEEKEA